MMAFSLGLQARHEQANHAIKKQSIPFQRAKKTEHEPTE
jgi:hypothetical protein